MWLCCVLLCQVTTRQAQEEPANAARSRRGHKSAQEQSSLVRDTNVEVISMMLQALEKEHRGLLNSLQGPIIAFIMDMLPVRLQSTHHMLGLQEFALFFVAWCMCDTRKVNPPPFRSCLTRRHNQDSWWHLIVSPASRHSDCYLHLTSFVVLLCAVCCGQEEMRETTLDDFRYEDLERLPTEELARITEWLTEKVDALSTRLKAEPKEDEVCRHTDS